jgi:hypothetical protein
MSDRLKRGSEVSARWFEALRPVCEDGSVLAVLEGLHWCHQHDVTPPGWFHVAASRTITRLVLGTNKKAGRAASGLNREREILKRLMRWDLVNEAKRGRENCLRDQELMRQHPNIASAEYKRRIGVVLDRLGSNLEDIFAFVSWQLEGTPLAGGPDAIKASYRRVERDMRSRSTAFKYYAFSYPALQAAGMTDIFDAVPAKKWPAFFASES